MLLNQSTTSEQGIIETWQNLLDEYEIQYLLLEVGSDRELISGMRHQAKWAVETEDEEAVLFARSDMTQAVM